MKSLIRCSGKITGKCILCLLTLFLVLLEVDTFVQSQETSNPEEGSAEQIATLMDTAKNHLENGEYAEAELIYNIIIEQYPGSDYALQARKQLAILYITSGDISAAESDINILKADFAQHDETADALYEIAMAYKSNEKADNALALNQYNSQNYPQAKRGMWSQVEVAYHYLDQKDFDGAQAAADTLISRFSAQETLAKEIYQVAMRFSQAGYGEKSIQLHQYNVDHFPEKTRAMWSQVELIKYYLDHNNHEAAHAGADTLINQFSAQETLPKEIYQVALRFGQAGDTAKHRELHQYNADNFHDDKYALWSLVELIEICYQQGDETAAQSNINKLLNDFPGHEDIGKEIYHVARRCSKQQRYNQSHPLYQHILTTWPQDQYALYALRELGRDYIDQGQDQQADAVIERVFSDYSDQKDSYDVIYWVTEKYYEKALLNRNEREEGPSSEDYLRKTIGIMERLKAQPNEPHANLDLVAMESLQTMGYCYQRLGQYEKAINCYEKLLADWPDYQNAAHIYYSIGKVYDKWRDAGDLAVDEAKIKARNAYETVLADYPESPAVRAAQIRLQQLE